MSAIDKFQHVLANRHQYASEWKKRTGGKAVGWLCTYSPPEIIYAAGMLPVRILGSHEPSDVAEQYVVGLLCPHCRDCLAQGLKGRYNYLDGITMARSCDHIEATFYNWREHVPIDFHWYLWFPGNIRSPRAMPLLTKEYLDYKRALEKWTERPIMPEDLDKAFELYNKNRRLMKQVYEFRKMDDPPITGAEAMEMVVASQLMDVAEHNVLLEELLKELPDRKVQRETGVRLMMLGSENDDVEFVRMLESIGITVVIEESCSGSRYFWNELAPQSDRLAALADRYIERWPCPAKDWTERRRGDIVLNLAKDFNAQGVILYQQKFCDPHGYVIPELAEMFKKNSIPTLTLEFDVTVPFGQFRTRVEAFLEMLMIETLL